MRELTRRYLPYPGRQQRSRRIARGPGRRADFGPRTPRYGPRLVGEVPSPDLPTSAAGSWGAEQEALAKKQRLLVDSPLELASLDLDESTAMGRQLATELNLHFGDWLLLATGGPRGG